MGKLFYHYIKILNSKHSFLQPKIDDVVKYLDLKRSTRGLPPEAREVRRDKEIATATQILMALYQAYVCIPQGTQKVSISLTESHYTGNAEYPYNLVKNVYNALSFIEWIDFVKGTEITGRVTRIKARGELAVFFDGLGLQWYHQKPRPIKDLIITRNHKNPEGRTKREKGKKVIVPTPKEPQVYQWTRNLFRINKFICKHFISLDLDDDQLQTVANSVKGEDAQSIDFYRVQIYRVFSRGSLEQGGRFYGGWWQSIPSRYRGHIVINEKQTIEVDYSSMALSCLLGIYDESAFLDNASRDLYDLDLDDWQGKSDPRRGVVKKFINALLYDDLGTYRLERDNSIVIGLSHQELLNLVIKKYPTIEEHLGTGIGLYLQFLDSVIAEKVMLKMMERKVLVLPIHDSFITRIGHGHALNDAMVESYKEVIKQIPNLKHELTKGRESFNLEDDEVVKISKDAKRSIVDIVDLIGDGQMFEHSIMSHYRDSWIVRRNER